MPTSQCFRLIKRQANLTPRRSGDKYLGLVLNRRQTDCMLAMDEEPKHDQTRLSPEDPTTKSEQTRPVNLSRPKSRHHHRQNSEEHPQTRDLPTPSDTGRPTFSQPARVLGSPKLAFTPGYPSRFPSSESSKSFDLHTQTGTTESERAILRNIDIQRILNSAGILGYDVDFGKKAPFDGPTVILYSRKSGPVARFKALTVSFGNELRRLEPFLARQTRGDVVGSDEDPEWRRWKEDTVLRLLTIITPAMGRLLERLTATAGGAVGQQGVGVLRWRPLSSAWVKIARGLTGETVPDGRPQQECTDCCNDTHGMLNGQCDRLESLTLGSMHEF